MRTCSMHPCRLHPACSVPTQTWLPAIQALRGPEPSGCCEGSSPACPHLAAHANEQQALDIQGLHRGQHLQTETSGEQPQLGLVSCWQVLLQAGMHGSRPLQATAGSVQW